MHGPNEPEIPAWSRRTHNLLVFATNLTDLPSSGRGREPARHGTTASALRQRRIFGSSAR